MTAARVPKAGLALLAALLLAGCALPPPRPGVMLAPDARIERLAGLTHWRFEGRIAVSGEHAGSGRVRWESDRGYYLVELRAPISGETWRLSGDAEQSQLDGLGPEPRRGTDAESLLARETGWRLPMRQAPSWLRGLPHDAARARVEFDGAGLPRRLIEDGWTIEYQAWSEPLAGLWLPSRLVARRPPHELRLAIALWQLDGGS